MKFKIEFELEDVNINDPLVTEEYILECLIERVRDILDWDGNCSHSDHAELWIDTENEKFNLYKIKVIG